MNARQRGARARLDGVPLGAGDLTALSALQAIGHDEEGTTRLAWTPQLAQAERWFEEQARAADLTVQRDAAGNLWAVPDSPPPWWGVGSHLDSVRQGGAFDGALGVAAAFALAQRSELPLAVVAFADEEGARFNTPTFGSRALTGVLDVRDALARTDADGVTLREALTQWGIDPEGVVRAPAELERLAGFLELHIDQSTELSQADSAVGVVGTIAARRRLRVEIRGASDHAGTTAAPQRRDALAAAAALIVASESFHSADATLRSSANHIEVQPNAATAIASRAVVLFDARARSGEALDGWVTQLHETAGALARQRRVEVSVRVDSSSPGVELAPTITAALLAHAPAGTPTVTCFAGHDAAILARRIPTGLVLVANPTGVSHAPSEHVSLHDAALGTQLMLDAVRALA
jgi:N-carbamoyl-L-amino-acid hydrolase